MPHERRENILGYHIHLTKQKIHNIKPIWYRNKIRRSLIRIWTADIWLKINSQRFLENILSRLTKKTG